MPVSAIVCWCVLVLCMCVSVYVLCGVCVSCLHVSDCVSDCVIGFACGRNGWCICMFMCRCRYWGSCVDVSLC